MRMNDLLGGTVRNASPDQLAGSVKEALSYDADTFMVYLGPPQSSYRRPLSELHVAEMTRLMQENAMDITKAVIHAPYIVNLAQADDEKRNYAVDFITREATEAIDAGFSRMVVHPGAFLEATPQEGLARIAKSLNEVSSRLSSPSFSILVETMAGKGSEACHVFGEIHDLLSLLPQSFGVCFDTCHVWDAGYDIRNDYEQVLSAFDQAIGLTRIGCLHLNDSKNPCGARKDRHANIGFGAIGFDALHRFYADPRFAGVPKILETPFVTKESGETVAPYRQEIAMIRAGFFDPQVLRMEDDHND